MNIRVLLWSLLLLAAVVFCADRLLLGSGLQSDILALIPSNNESKTQQAAKDQIQRSAERKFLLLVRDNGTPLLEDSLQHLQQALISQDFAVPKNDALPMIKKFYWPYRYQLLTQTQRQELISSTAAQLSQSVLTSLYNGFSSPRAYPVMQDPFDLASPWLNALFNQKQQFLPSAVPSMDYQGHRWYVINGELPTSPFDLATQTQLSVILSQLDVGDSDIYRSGLVFHAMAGAKLAQREISTVGMGSLLGIIVLVCLVFRTMRALSGILIVLGSSTVFALSACFVIFQQVHLVTLAFGSTLLGLVADYCFHFYCKWQSQGDSAGAVQLIRKGLLVSVMTTVLAYFMQLFSPFPGLQQFSVFMISGLISAVLTVIYVLPALLGTSLLPPPKSKYFEQRIEPIYRCLAGFFAMRWLVLSCLALLFIAVVNASKNDDIRQLNTSGSNLLSEEKFVQQALVSVDSQRYIIVSKGRNEDSLQALEKLSDSSGFAFVHAANYVPSLKQQRLDYSLIEEKLFSSAGAISLLCKEISAFCGLAIPEFDDGLVLNSIPSALNNLFALDTVTGTDFLLALPPRDSSSFETLQPFVEQDVSYVDNIDNLTRVLTSVHSEVEVLLMIFLLVLATYLYIAQRHAANAILVSVCFAMFGALAFVVGSGVSLFHILALLLVLGITLDTNIFYARLGVNRDTWLASTLSCWTSLLAFGLLSGSDVPLLSQFGIIVFWGLLIAWLISPLSFYLLSDFGGKHARQN